MLLQSLLSNLAAAGLATKAAAGGAAVIVAASAAGAADALPDPAQETFDRITAEATVDAEDAEGEGPEDGTFGARVSQDATGESDGESGVDGPTIACEASEGRSGTCDEGADDLESTDDSDGGEFGERVSQDATGEDGSDPGVDGEEISDEARAINGEQGADNAPDDVPADGDDDDDDDDEDDDNGGPEGTPGADAVDTFRPSDDD